MKVPNLYDYISLLKQTSKRKPD